MNFGYDKKNRVFTKTRHWEAIYRIAADYGFIIDGDYDYFKKIIDDMNIPNLPKSLTVNFLQKNNVGVYANNINDWTEEGLYGRDLAVYKDIKHCADVFENIVKNDIKKYK